MDTATIVTALLHDVIEDTEVTRDEIARVFGEEIAELVEGVTKLSRLALTAEYKRQAENLRKFILAISKDVRVLLVKLADGCTTCAPCISSRARPSVNGSPARRSRSTRRWPARSAATASVSSWKSWRSHHLNPVGTRCDRP